MSPATIRNVMSDLEERGYLISPHTSAGRIPTAMGYRLFVDSLLQVKPLEREAMAALRMLDTMQRGNSTTTPTPTCCNHCARPIRYASSALKGNPMAIFIA